ncbi:MAG: hypothetical protein AB8B50_19720 [Pirellulaceae bacterium]
MSQKGRNIWKDNGGSVLLSVACLSVALTSLLWYFKLLPEIEFTPMQAVGQNAPPPVQQPTTLIVTIVSTGELPGKTVTGFVEIHDVFGTIGLLPDAISTHPFQLHEKGLTSVVVDGLSPGSYSPIIFVDSNGNGVLDVGGKNADPLRTAQFEREYPSGLELEENSLEIEANSPTYLYIYF